VTGERLTKQTEREIDRKKERKKERKRGRPWCWVQPGQVDAFRKMAELFLG